VMSEEVIVLCSGGFDTVVLLHSLKLEEKDVVAVFFDYGQVNAKKEKECSEKVCEKLGFKLMQITLPDFYWSKSTLRSGEIREDRDQYVEMRNLVFLSYAVSIAETFGIKDIYMAVLKSGLGFTDTSESFITGFNTFVNQFGITLHTPFSDMQKEELGFLARMFDISREDFFSCNTPTINDDVMVPCNKCGDCQNIEYIYTEIVEDNTPIKAWLKSEASEKFNKLFRENTIGELRALINNECQFKCSHCFYGFDEMTGVELTIDEFCSAMSDFIACGISNIHFSGKEPFFNTDIFLYCNYLKEKHPQITYDVVTNGVNVLKYGEEIKNAGFNKIYLSVDSLYDLTIRPTNNHIIEVLNFLKDNNMTTQVFLDAHKNNYREIDSMITTLNKEFGVKEFHVRPVMPIGGGKELDTILNAEELDELFQNLCKLTGEFLIEFSLRNPWTKEYLDGGYALTEALEMIKATGYNYVEDNIVVLPEFYCGRFESQVTLTPDGYVLGCGTEVASKNYAKLSVGNVKDTPVKDLISAGKEMSLKYISKGLMCGCPHTSYKIKY